MQSGSIPINTSGGVAIITTATLCIVLPTSLVALRIAAQRRTTLDVTRSDYCIVAALVFEVALCIVDYFMVAQGGFGYHTTTVIERFGENTLVIFYKCMAAWPILWNCCVMTSKWSVLFMYMTLMPVRELILTARIIGAFVVVFNLGGVSAAFIICRPYAKNYYVHLAGTCGNTQTFYIWLSAMNLFSDLVILLLPIRFVYKLKLPLRKRIGLIAMFSVGLLTCGVTLYRQIALPQMDLSDVTYSGILAFLLSTVEIAVSIMIACVPFLGPFWRPAVARLSTSRSHGIQNSGFNSNSTTYGGMFSKGSAGTYGAERLDSIGEVNTSGNIEMLPSGDREIRKEGWRSGNRPGVRVETRWEVESSPAHEVEQPEVVEARWEIEASSMDVAEGHHHC